MRENWRSYTAITNYFGEKKVEDRYRFLYEKMNEYIKARELEDKLYINEGLLQQAVMDYFADAYRLKTFHELERMDTNKIIAYEAAWLIRRKPLVPKEDVKDSRLLFANEGFVTVLIAHEIMESFGNEPMDEEEEEHFLEFLEHLHYHLKYRAIDKQELEIMLLAFKTGKKI